VYAKIVSTTGGTTKTTAVIQQEDISKAREALSRQLQDKLAAQLASTAPSDQFLSDPTKDTFTLDNVTFNVTVGAEQDQGTVSGNGTARRLAVRRSEIDRLAREQSQPDAGLPLTIPDLTIGTTSFSTAESTAQIEVKVTGKTATIVSSDALAQAAVGRPYTDASTAITNQVNNASVTFTRTPAWWPIKRVPWFKRSVSVTVVNE